MWCENLLAADLFIIVGKLMLEVEEWKSAGI
jgi:hypothetical protein